MRNTVLLLFAAVLLLAPSSSAGSQSALKAETLRRYEAPEAHQGVAADAVALYAIDNSRIAKYDEATGRKLAEWKGDPQRFPHLNSCAVIGRELVCANSNYPHVPMMSFVEFFDADRMTHLRTVPLGQQGGSLTWVQRRDGAWWAGFANYDGRGGEPGRDHRQTQLVKFDDQWRRLQAWTFPEAVLERFKPYSTSGGVFGADGRLYVTGHDRPEVYILAAPKAGAPLEHLATIEAPFEGQAIAVDPARPDVFFGISRAGGTIFAARLPKP